MPYFPPEEPKNIDRFNEYELHMKKLMHTHLIEFDLPTKILYALADNGIKRLGDLVASTPSELMKIPHLGTSAIRYLRIFIEYHKLNFGMKIG